jgi:hypothetical protein
MEPNLIHQRVGKGGSNSSVETIPDRNLDSGKDLQLRILDTPSFGSWG